MEGNLVSILSRDEKEWLYKLDPLTTSNTNLWIGLNSVNGEFVETFSWTDGSEYDEWRGIPWASRQPRPGKLLSRIIIFKVA